MASLVSFCNFSGAAPPTLRAPKRAVAPVVTTGFNGGRSQVNLNFPQWGGDYPFLNCFKTAQQWSLCDNSGPPEPNTLDGDGYPDLYVCQYVNWSFANHPVCQGYTRKVPRDVCPPKTFTGLPHKLFRNNGNGTFTDVSKEAGLRPHTGDPLKDSEVGAAPSMSPMRKCSCSLKR